MGKKNKSKTAAKPAAHKFTIEIPAPQIVEEIAEHHVPSTIKAVVASAFFTAVLSFLLLFVFQMGGLLIFGISAVLFVAFAVLFYLLLERK